MNAPAVYIPFALPPAEHAKDLIRLLEEQTGGDGLALLLSRSSTSAEQFDDFSLILPHERRLNQQRLPLQSLLDRLPLNLPAGTWFILNPVHLHIASNHLVLTDYRQLDLRADEAQLLFEQAQAIIAGHGLTLVFVNEAHWLLQADAWQGLLTASPDAACGHNIDIWSPQGEPARAWRRLQNEIQMEWFIHPVQQQRAQRAAKPVNGLWLWGGTTISGPVNRLPAPPASVNTWLAAPELIVLESLTASALAGDWGSWLASMQDLEQTWFKPLCAALKAGQLKQLELVLSNSNSLLSVRGSALGMRKFWQRGRFNALLP